MIRRQQTGNADVFTTMILDILHSLLNVSEPRLFETLLRRDSFMAGRLWSAIPVHLQSKKKWGNRGIDVSGVVNRERSCAVNGSRSMVGPQHGLLQDFELDERAIEVKAPQQSKAFA